MAVVHFDSGPPVEPEYWDAERVAGLLLVKASTVYGWAKRDPSMPVIRICGTVRFPRARLLEWLRSREQGRPPVRRRVLAVTARVESGGTGAS